MRTDNRFLLRNNKKKTQPKRGEQTFCMNLSTVHGASVYEAIFVFLTAGSIDLAVTGFFFRFAAKKKKIEHACLSSGGTPSSKKKKVEQGEKRGHRALVPACKHFAVKNTHDSKSKK
jgi:hypothetical protein